MVLDWLTICWRAAIQGIKQIFPVVNVPPDSPVAARKFPVTSCIEMPTSPVVVLASTNRLLTESYEAVTPAADSLMLFRISWMLSVVAL